MNVVCIKKTSCNSRKFELFLKYDGTDYQIATEEYKRIKTEYKSLNNELHLILNPKKKVLFMKILNKINFYVFLQTKS